jgi:hypothetical protein
MARSSLKRYLSIILAILGGIGASPAIAEQTQPVLIITVSVRPGDRAALRADMANAQAPRLDRFREAGLISGYRLLFSRYADGDSWDALEELRFPSAAAMSRWTQVEQTSPGGFDTTALGIAQAIRTTPSILIQSSGRERATSSLLIIPYQVLVPTDEYARYLTQYTIPQFKGWMALGVLDGFDIMSSRYPAGRDWSTLIVLRYHDDASLDRRDEVVAATRAKLAADPVWKAASENKKAIRAERALAVADVIAMEGGAS